MTDKTTAEHANESNTIKNPDDWTTGDERMTGAQRSYLKTLSEEAKAPFDENLFEGRGVQEDRRAAAADGARRGSGLNAAAEIRLDDQHDI